MEFSNQEILFIHSHNKQTLKDVAKLLVDAKIPVSVITDIDILNDESDFVKIFETLTGIRPDEHILKLRNEISLSVNKIDDKTILNNVKTVLQELILQLDNGQHNLDGLKGAYNRVEKEFTKWKNPKNEGVTGFESSVQHKVIELINSTKKIGLFIVPVGELEGWIDLKVKKKNKWIIPALDLIHEKKSPEPLKKICR